MRWIKKIAGIRGMARLEISLGLGLVLAVLLASQSSFSQVCRQVRQDTLRLHIRAASDSAADQADKLAVRDAVVQAAAVLFDGQTSREEAVAIASQNLDLLQQVANDTLQSRGSGSSATVILTDMLFDTTWYQDFTMPAGRYQALRIDIGQATGKNWWCVLFPPLCLPAAETLETTEVYSDEEKQVLQSGYELRFAAVEWWQRLWDSEAPYDGC